MALPLASIFSFCYTGLIPRERGMRVKRILFWIPVLVLCIALVLAACERNVTITDDGDKYEKYEQLFSYLENGDFESAHAYIHDFFGVEEAQPKATDPAPTTQPPEPTTAPTQPTTVPTEPVTVPTEPTTVPTEPTTVPTEPVTVPTEPVTVATEPTTVPTEPVIMPTEPTEPSTAPTDPESEMVWIPKSGEKYHTNPTCSNMKDPTQVTKEEAERRGYEPCKRCHK